MGDSWRSERRAGDAYPLPMRRALLLCCLLALAALPGCTGLEPAMIGAAVSGAQTGVTLLSGGEMRSFELARFDDVVAGVERAAASLALEERKAIRDEGRVWLDYRYNGHSMKVEILRRTERVTSVFVTVRKKTHRGMAALFLRDLFHELREAGVYLEDWRTGDSPVTD